LGCILGDTFTNSSGHPGFKQGDQIARIFACWAIVFFGQSIANYISSANSWDIFFNSIIYLLIWTKNVGATFSHTHLVTLVSSQDGRRTKVKRNEVKKIETRISLRA
jgi:hypothetical protein